MNELAEAYHEGVKLATGKLLTSMGGAGLGGLAGALSAGEDEDPFMRVLLGAGAGAGLGRAGLALGRKYQHPALGALLGIGAGAGGVAALPGAKK
jgi:hypothetical protein